MAEIKRSKTSQYSYGDRWFTLYHSDGTKESHPFPLDVSSFPEKDMYGNPLPKHLQYFECRYSQACLDNDRYSFGEKGYTVYYSNGNTTYHSYGDLSALPPVDMYDRLRPDLV